MCAKVHVCDGKEVKHLTNSYNRPYIVENIILDYEPHISIMFVTIIIYHRKSIILKHQSI